MIGTVRVAGSVALLGMLLPTVVLSAERPCLVLLIADDLGYGELGCYGGKEIPTPAVDRLAAAGVRFSDGYVTAPYCAASRAGLFTGRYQTRFGFEFNPVGAKNEVSRIGLPVSQRTIADFLKDAGYATGLVGKWHLGAAAPYHPQRRGFDEFFGFLHEGHYYVPPPYQNVTTWLRRRRLPDGGFGRWIRSDGRLIWSTHLGHNEPPYDANNPLLRGSQPVAETTHLTDAFTREAVDFIRRHREQPFFLCVSYNAVHSPMQGADAYMKKFADIEDVQRRIFAAMLAHLDDSVGEILQELQEQRLADQTLVVFLSDNGGPTRELTSRNTPLRGGKGEVFEGGVRVPLIARWPGKLPAGRTIREPVISLDLAPTFLAAAGIDPPDALDGVDWRKRLAATDLPPRTLYWRLGGRTALRRGAWKLLQQRQSRQPGDDWKLYDLASDRGEQQDLAPTRPRELADMIQRWQAINREMVDPAW